MESIQEISTIKALFLGGNPVAEFLFRYSLNMVMTFAVVRWLYYQSPDFDAFDKTTTAPTQRS